MTSSFETIATVLEQHEDTLRVRKLLFCVCERRWENNTGVLRNLSLGQLVTTLRNKYASLTQLSDALFGVVQQLNRQNQYARIAQVVLNQMGPLYEGEEGSEPTQFNGVPDSTEFLVAQDTDINFSYERLAQALDSESEILRIRKMLWCACRQQWESNAQTLLVLDLAALLEELHYSFPTEADLRTGLDRVVQSVNRKAEYGAIAETLMSHLHPLYHAAPPTEPPTDLSEALPPDEVTELPTDLSSELPAMAVPTDLTQQDTLILKPTTAQLETIVSTQPTAPQTAAPQLASPQTIAQTAAPQTTAQMKTVVSSPQTQAQLETIVSDQYPKEPPPLEETEYGRATGTDFNPDFDLAVANTDATATAPTYDTFTVRLEVMKYANPLRAKILAFSALHHTFETRGQDWPHLRTQPFDELLQTLYQSYETLEILTEQLNTIAEQLESPEDSLQAAEAIIKAMKPYYSPCP
ncbi:MAG: hypothetical protein AAGG51_08750 [Cyanobacteria bacterium P01_G01_bin.54]